MKNIQDHIILESESVIKALDKLNKLPSTLTLFVVNREQQLIGTLTDGDVRRGFLNGGSLNDNIGKFVPSDFQYLNENIDLEKVKSLKNKGIRLLPVLDGNKKITKVYDLSRLNSILPLEAVIMAGGRGARLRPITDTIPKPMIDLGGKPILEHTVDRLISYGIENIYISVNYLKEQIKDYFGDGGDKGINIQYIEEKKPLGTAGALSMITNLKKDILLTNSDLFTNIDYEDLYLSYLNQNADMAVASITYTVNIPYAILSEENGSITNFKEKPSNTHYANAGIYVLRKDLIKQIPTNTHFNTTDLMQEAIDANMKIIHNPLIGYWIDIGKHEDLRRAQEIIKHI